MKYLNDKDPRMRPNRMILSRTLFLMIVCGIVAFIVLAVKLYTIQIRDHEFYESLALEQQTFETKIPAARGTIYDKNGEELAVSSTAYSVYISPYEIQYFKEDKEKIADTLSQVLGVNRDAVIKKTEDIASWYKTVAVKIDSETANNLRLAISENDFKSIHIESDTKRWYPNGSLACHVIGFVGIDGTGLEGIEALYDEYLTGVDGNVSRLAAANGTEMLSGTYEKYVDAVDGCDLTLTIDAGVQKIVEKCVEQAIEDYDVQNGGCAIVMNVKTGAILALASFENYDLNNYRSVSEEKQKELEQITDKDEYNAALREAQLKQWRNMALNDTYEPGSVFKTITMAIGLDSGAISAGDSFFCGGAMNVLGRNKPLNCWRHSGHGSQTLAEAAQHSCNVAFVNIGLRIGAETFYDYAKNFGLFEKTGIDLIGEAGSQWWDEEIFFNTQNLSQLAAASFGQTFNITPIQLITAISAAVNGGELMQPYVVDSATDADGAIVYKKDTSAVRTVISETTSQTVRDILESVVGSSGGTGKNAAVAGYRIGGKTGTSEKTGKAIVDGKKEYIVSFCGIAPMEDPELAVLVLLDTPSHETGLYISGGNMAAPAVGNIFADVLPYLGYEREYTEEELSVADVTVPQLVGKSVEEAQNELRELGLQCSVDGAGATVTGQLPMSGADISAGSTVIIYTEDAPKETMSVVPDLQGLTFEEAQAELEKAGLYMQTSDLYAGNEDAVVRKQSITYGSEAPSGTVIEVSIMENVDEGVE